MDEIRSNIITLAIGLIGLSVLMLGYVLFTKDNPITGYRPRLTIKEPNLELRLAINEPYSFEGRVYDNMSMSEILKTLGIYGGVLALSQEDYDIYSSRFATGKQCPGPFLSKRANPLLLLPRDANMRQQMARLTFKRGDRIRVSGASVGILGGESGPYTMGTMESDSQMNIVLVTNFVLNGASYWSHSPIAEDTGL